MKTSQFVGVGLLVLGIVIIAGYGIFVFAIEEEIPLFIRIGLALIAVGVVLVLLSLVKERLRDLKKERQYKSKEKKADKQEIKQKK
ncbi:hypothetical protein ACFLQO_00395 [Candidatus Aenigmatarchaeota archaeon]